MNYTIKPQRNQNLGLISAKRENLKKHQIKSTQVRSDLDCWGHDPFITSIEVWETEPEGTGIIDIHGNEFVRLPNPIGFVDPEEL
jgi:hypothetical protein